jgi:tetratricopeptide (TPR) repeat protein
MSKKPNLLIRFWHELHRRKVFKVLAMYAGSAFVVIQVIDILTNRLNLPPWIATLIIIILSIGFPVAAILAWIFDLTPEGIKKTESIEESEGREIVVPPSRRRLKPSDVVIAVLALVVVILAWPKIFKHDSLERMNSSGARIAVAVMPFMNMTDDTIGKVLQYGIQENLISSLSETGELIVRQKESVNSLLKTKSLDESASISQGLAGTFSRKLDADLYIYGSIKKAGPSLRIDAQLIGTKTNEVFKSFKIERPSGGANIFQIIDTLSSQVKNYLLISKLMKENSVSGLNRLTTYSSEASKYLTTSSSEALKYSMLGDEALFNYDYSSAEAWYLKAYDIDSNYFNPMFSLSNVYADLGKTEQAINWILKCHKKKDQWPPIHQLLINWVYALFFESLDEQLKYSKQRQQIDDQGPSTHNMLGQTYFKMKQYDKVIPEIEKSLEITGRWDKEWLKDNQGFFMLGRAYEETGQFKKEKRLLKKAKKYIPETWVNTLEALLAFAEKDTVEANRYIEKFIAVKKAASHSEAFIATGLGDIYYQAGIIDKAEEYYSKAVSLESENLAFINVLASFLIDNNRNLDTVQGLMDKAMELASNKVDYYEYLNTKGWALFKQGKNQEALEIIQKAWDEAPYKLYSIRSHLEEVKKAAERK